VVTGLSTIEEWHKIKTCFRENNRGSRIIVSTDQVEVARLCTGQERMGSKLKQLSTDTVHAFYQQSFQDIVYPSDQASTSTQPPIAENEIHKFQLIGREKDRSTIIELLQEQASTDQFQVIVVYGMDGLGKTTLVKDIYQRQGVTDMFDKHAFVTVLQPFKLEELFKSLASDQDAREDTHEDFAHLPLRGNKSLIGKLTGLLERKRCLIVLDDLFSTMEEWDMIVQALHEIRCAKLIILITTRKEDIAKHCCNKPERTLAQGSRRKQCS